MYRQIKRRKRFIIMAVFALLVFSPTLHATRILIFGDSWGAPMKPALEAVFSNNGHTEVIVETTEFWSLAAQLSLSEGLNFITEELNLRPELDIVHLSIGVNDVHCIMLGSTCVLNWKPAMAGTQTETDILATIMTDVETIADHILSTRPEVQIFWAGDDYIRPRNTSWFGTPAEHNAVHIKQAELAQQLADRKPGLTFVHLHGLLQVTFGFDGIQYTQWDPPHPIPPGDPSLPDPGLPSPNKVFADAAHPNKIGYGVLAGGYYEEFYGPLLNGPGFQINAGLNDAWYNPVTDGQGFFITVFPDLNAVSLAWFTYDTELPDSNAIANLGDAGHRWLTAVGPIVGNQAIMEIEMTSGGLFDTATLIDRTDPPGSDGTIILTFTSCNSATVEYDIPSINRQGIVPIQRVADDNVVVCEALSKD
jgi:hypothetical protein